MQRTELASLYKATPADGTKVTVCGWPEVSSGQAFMGRCRAGHVRPLPRGDDVTFAMP